jgi:hypothetical protein
MRSPGPHPALVFAVIFIVIFLLHAPLLQLPYFWDEAGYYVPAARDILLGGSFIPHSTPSNAHPPLVMAWVALWWKCVGYAPLVTRSAMLMVAAFSLLGVFRLAQRVANTEVAMRQRRARRCIQCSSRRVLWRKSIWRRQGSRSGEYALISKIDRSRSRFGFRWLHWRRRPQFLLR